jgi:purine-binding chemotaxis protein CheW
MNDGKILLPVTFKLENEEFAVDMLEAREINKMIDFRRISNAPLFVEEIMNLRRKIILVKLDSLVLGFIVNSVFEVFRISEIAVEPPPPLVSGMESEYIEGIGKLENRLLILLELRKVFMSNDRRELETASSN